MIISYEYKENILLWITEKVFSKNIEIIYLSLPEALWNFLLISIWGGLLISTPWIILNLYGYLRSGLYEKEVKYWDPLIKVVVVGWIPFHYSQVSIVWPSVANWFLSYSNEYSNLSYLPTMNQFFSFLLNWSSLTSLFFFFFLGLLFRVWSQDHETMVWYTSHREKFLLVTLLIGGILTPPDLISQILVAIVMLSTLEIVVLLESYKMGLFSIRSSVGRAAIF